jgi:hypothetical protein
MVSGVGLSRSRDVERNKMRKFIETIARFGTYLSIHPPA